MASPLLFTRVAFTSRGERVCFPHAVKRITLFNQTAEPVIETFTSHEDLANAARCVDCHADEKREAARRQEGARAVS